MSRRAAKIVFRSLFVPLMFPLALLSGFGRVKSLQRFFAQALAFTPGGLGTYLRTAYYFQTLERFSILAYTDVGTIFAHRETEVSEDAGVGAYCILGRVRIGVRTRLASGVQVLSGQGQHARDEQGRLTVAGAFTMVTIGPDCWIGAGAIIMSDVGARVTVAAGSVVATPVPDDATAMGNPARAIRSSRP